MPDTAAKNREAFADLIQKGDEIGVCDRYNDELLTPAVSNKSVT